MEIEFLIFGQLNDMVIKDKVDWAKITSTDLLQKELQRLFPEIHTVNYAIAINKKIANTNTQIHAGDTIALLPAFAGG